MLVNGNERLNIWLSLSNRFDYNEFVVACAAASITPLDGMEFAQKAGTVQAGIVESPELAPDVAYLQYLKNHQNVVYGQVLTQSTVPSITAASEVKPCASCGGGTVR